MEILKFAWRQGMSDERVDEIFAQGKAVAVARDDVHAQLGLLYGVGCNYMLSARPRRSIPFFEQSLALAEPTGDAQLRWAAREPFEFALLLLGDLLPALRMNDEQVAFSDSDPTIGLTTVVGFSTAFTFAHRGWILTDLGRFDEASAAFRRCEKLARQFNENDPMLMNDALCCRMLERRGDTQVALSMGRRTIDAAEKSGNQFARVLGHGFYGTALAHAAEWHDSQRSLKLALQVARVNRAALFIEADLLAALAQVHLHLGDSSCARVLAEQAIEVALRVEMPVAEVHAQWALARVLRANQGADGNAAIEMALHRAQHSCIQVEHVPTSHRSTSNAHGSPPYSAMRQRKISSCARHIVCL